MAKRKTAKQVAGALPKSRGNRSPAKTVTEQSPRSPGLSFPVVAVGASAGGLAAFTALLKALPAKSGMAFVLIRHLEPKHEIALTALLSKATRMPVTEVSDGMAAEPNHVYIIPPNKGMTIRQGVLRISARSEAPGLQRPIDDFFVTLAAEQGEELETAKEELQSANEELITLNDELQHRNTELNVLTHDLSNLLVGVDIPVVVLDADLRIRRFTPMAGTLLNLIAGDIGRPFGNIASTLDVADWKGLFSEVTTHGRLVDREVADRSGHRYSMRVRPYRIDGDIIAGVLVVLFDVDMLQRTIAEARDVAVSAEQRGDSILNSLASHVAVIAQDGTILKTNDAWNRFVHEDGSVPLRAGTGANYLQVCRQAAALGVPYAQPALDCLRTILDNRSRLAQLEYACHSPTEQRWFLMSVSPLKGGGGAVVAHLNITGRKLAETAAEMSEATIRALLDSATQSIIVVREDGIVTLASAYTERIFGYPVKELIGKSLEILIPEESRERHREKHRIYFRNIENRPMGIGLTLEALRRDGTRFPAEIGLSAFQSNEGKLAVAFVSDITERRQLERTSHEHAMQVQALASRLLVAQEDERRRVSRELHDQVCQQLAALAIEMGGYTALPPSTPEERVRRIVEMQTRVVKISEATRHIAYQLHPSVLDDLGLVASLRALCNEFTTKDNIAVEFDNGAMPAEISREVASCLYRVAQESLQNIARHSGAKHASVTVNVQKDSLVLSVSDDGTGFDLKSIAGKGGLGLIGMQERARMVNGTLAITSQRRRGTRVVLTVPLAAEL